MNKKQMILVSSLMAFVLSLIGVWSSMIIHSYAKFNSLWYESAAHDSVGFFAIVSIVTGFAVLVISTNYKEL